MIIGVNGRFLAARHTGVQRFAREVVARLQDRADVVLFVPQDADVPDTWAARVVRGSMRGQSWEQFELPRRARHTTDVLFSPANSGPLRARRHVVMIHDVFPLQHRGWYSRSFASWYRFLLPRLARKADIVLTSSEYSASAIAALARGRRDHVRVVPQGVQPFDEPASAHDTERVRTRFGIAGAFVLALGDGDPRKNIVFAVQVVHRYRLRYGDAPVLVVAGNTSTHVHGGTARLEMTHGIRVGHVTDAELRSLYTGASALLYPSLDEGFGRPPLEAMGCGTPVLAANYAAAAEVLEQTAAVCLPLEPNAWVLALRSAIQRGRISADERALVLQRWSWDAAAEAVVVACRDAAGATAAAV